MTNIALHSVVELRALPIPKQAWAPFRGGPPWHCACQPAPVHLHPASCQFRASAPPGVALLAMCPTLPVAQLDRARGESLDAAARLSRHPPAQLPGL